MRLGGGDSLYRCDDESCISADDFTAAAVVGGEVEPETFNNTYTLYSNRALCTMRICYNQSVASRH